MGRHDDETNQHRRQTPTANRLDHHHHRDPQTSSRGEIPGKDSVLPEEALHSLGRAQKGGRGHAHKVRIEEEEEGGIATKCGA